MTPPRNDIGNDVPGRQRSLCPVCARSFTAVRRQQYCTPACRQAAWRNRQPTPGQELVIAHKVANRVSKRAVTIYICDSCDERYLGQQWCDDCNRPCSRLGLGGLCTHCEEPVVIDEILKAHNDDLPANRP